jgi:hypothetical protein
MKELNGYYSITILNENVYVYIFKLMYRMARPLSQTPSRSTSPASYYYNLPMTPGAITIDTNESDKKILEAATSGLNRSFLNHLNGQSNQNALTI